MVASTDWKISPLAGTGATFPCAFARHRGKSPVRAAACTSLPPENAWNKLINKYTINQNGGFLKPLYAGFHTPKAVTYREPTVM